MNFQSLRVISKVTRNIWPLMALFRRAAGGVRSSVSGEHLIELKIVGACTNDRDRLDHAIMRM